VLSSPPPSYYCSFSRYGEMFGVIRCSAGSGRWSSHKPANDFIESEQNSLATVSGHCTSSHTRSNPRLMFLFSFRLPRFQPEQRNRWNPPEHRKLPPCEDVWQFRYPRADWLLPEVNEVFKKKSLCFLLFIFLFVFRFVFRRPCLFFPSYTRLRVQISAPEHSGRLFGSEHSSVKLLVRHEKMENGEQIFRMFLASNANKFALELE
jgi:hypothetical protein